MTDGSSPRSTVTREVTGSSGGSTVTTARTRLVGERTGWSADALVTVVRAGRAVGRVASRAGRAASSVVTPLGWVVIAVAPLSLGAGYLWGWTELVLAGAVGVALTIVAVAYLVGRIRLHFQLVPPPVRVAVGDEAHARLVVTNPTSRRSFGTVVDLPVGERIVPIAVPGIGPGDRVEPSVALPTDRRGRLTVGPVKTVRADPVGLVRREYHWADAAEFIIHPRTIDVPSTSSGLVRDLEGRPTRDLTVSDLAFHALREYVPGDDRRHIHWKSSAKTGTFMVRQFEETRRSRMLLALSIASVDFGSDAEFELGVSAAASLGARAIRDARDVDVLVSEITPEFAKRAVVAVRPLPTLTPNRLLDELAVVEHGPAALGVVDVARLASDAVPGVSVAILVVGSTVAPRRLRTAAAAFPASVEVIAVQCDPDTVPGRRSLGSLTVLTVGSLTDLRRAIRGGETE
ncbi:DUF58 domain-containing protein [Microcella alkaliphila]|uniref:DUF58 domain-containing protein n=1 Tax=Microcella alkaliphila TaxID=279828 RepID=A0A0U5BA48_9MICO|nr:DUF58 domain-containing protein [Microcella alkaliphila]BAU32676.1 uncharacterized protein MalAC0309_1828 [Microcella alkaliphila]